MTKPEDLEAAFRAARWQPAWEVSRPFVRHSQPTPSPAQVWRVGSEQGPVTLSVVIPTEDADRGGYFRQLLRQLNAQTFQDFELIVVKGDFRQGRAINVGAALAQGRYLMTLDDDTSLRDRETVRRLCALMDEAPDIGLAGGNNVVPEDAPPFVQAAMRQIPRRSWEPVPTVTDSDLAEHPCLIMRRDEFCALGGENELLPRGLDPYLRQVFRDAGKRVVVAPGVLYSHLPPVTWRKLVRQYYRNGKQAAFVNRHYPQWVIETPGRHGTFAPRVPFPLRVVRSAGRLAGTVITGQWIWLSCQVAYAVGFLSGWIGDRHSSPLAGRAHG